MNKHFWAALGLALVLSLAASAQTPTGISEFPSGTPNSDSNSFVACLQSSCKASDVTVTARNVTFGALSSYILGKLAATPPITFSSNAIGLAIDSTLSVVGGQLHVVSGGGGSGTVASSTIGQVPVYTAATTVTGSPAITFSSGLFTLNQNAVSSFPAFAGSSPHLLIVGADTAASKIAQLTFNSASGSTTTMAASGGTGASPTALASAAKMGTFGFAGYDGTNITSSATMSGVAAENQTPSAHGTNLVFSTTPTGSTTLTTGLTIGSDQNITVAGQAGSGVRCVHVDNTGKQSLASGDCGTGGSGSVTSLSQGTGMSFSANPITTTGTIGLANTAVTPGSYTNLNATINAQGQVTAASNGSGGGGVSSVGLGVPASSIFGVTGSPVTTIGTLGLTTTGTPGGIPYFSSGTQLSSSGALALYGTVIGGGAGGAPVTVPPNTAGFVLTSNGGAANPTFQAPSGGGTAVQSYGVFGGAVNAYTMASPTPAVSTNTGGYTVRGTWPSGLASNTGAATLAVGSAAALPIRVRSANNGIIALTGKELLPGTNGNTFTFQLDSTASFWVLDSQAPGSSTTNPSSPYTITQGDWASQGVFLQTTAGTTYNLPNLGSTTLSSQAGVTIQTVGVTAQLCAAGTDVINNGLLTGASSAGGCITLPADGIYPINTSGTAGTTAWSVPLGQLQYFFLTWAEGLNLSTNARYISRFASPKVIYGIKCNVQAAAGSASTVQLFSTASGSAPNSGTRLDASGCNANTASNTEQDMGVASGGLGTTTPGYTIWATFSGSGTSGNGGLTITYR
jgi:hypothetical protein